MKEHELMELHISMTSVLENEDVEALIGHCSSNAQFMSCVRKLASGGYLIPLVVLQYCFEGR